MWRAQVMPAIRGAMLTGMIDGTDAAPSQFIPKENLDKDKDPIMVLNPEYVTWLARDQKVLSYLVNSLSKEILMHVLRLEHVADVWKAVEEMFASQSSSKIMNLRIALANTKKNNMSLSAFFTKMQGYADEMAAAGKPLPEDELVSFLLAGLGGHYNALVAALGVVKTPLSVAELYSQIQNYDERQEMLASTHDEVFETSANAAARMRTRGGGGGYRSRNDDGRDERRYDERRYDDRRDRRQDDRCPDERRRDNRRQDDRPHFNQGGGRGGRAPFGGGRGRGRGRRRSTPWVDVTCQICRREGHAAKDCWYRFQDDDGDDDMYAYGIDTNCDGFVA
jgi:hypothetical protein